LSNNGRLGLLPSDLHAGDEVPRSRVVVAPRYGVVVFVFIQADAGDRVPPLVFASQQGDLLQTAEALPAGLCL